MSIKWKEAPTDATHYNENNDMFYRLKDGIYYFYASDDLELIIGGPPSAYELTSFIERPQPKPWSGPEDGLPPIGLSVMVHECSHDYTKKFNGQTVRIVGHDRGDLAVFAAKDFIYHALIAEKFKLPPTAEQLAAEEREKAAQDMWSSIEYVREKGVFSFLDLMRALHDQGFKREVK